MVSDVIATATIIILIIITITIFIISSVGQIVNSALTMSYCWIELSKCEGVYFGPPPTSYACFVIPGNVPCRWDHGKLSRWGVVNSISSEWLSWIRNEVTAAVKERRTSLLRLPEGGSCSRVCSLWKAHHSLKCPRDPNVHSHLTRRFFLFPVHFRLWFNSHIKLLKHACLYYK